MSANCFSVFTKPWKNVSLDELGALVAEMGFDAVEYPFRDGYQVQPDDGVEGIQNARLQENFRKHGAAVIHF